MFTMGRMEGGDNLPKSGTVECNYSATKQREESAFTAAWYKNATFLMCSIWAESDLINETEPSGQLPPKEVNGGKYANIEIHIKTHTSNKLHNDLNYFEQYRPKFVVQVTQFVYRGIVHFKKKFNTFVFSKQNTEGRIAYKHFWQLR